MKRKQVSLVEWFLERWFTLIYVCFMYGFSLSIGLISKLLEFRYRNYWAWAPIDIYLLLVVSFLVTNASVVYGCSCSNPYWYVPESIYLFLLFRLLVWVSVNCLVVCCIPESGLPSFDCNTSKQPVRGFCCYGLLFVSILLFVESACSADLLSMEFRQVLSHNSVRVSHFLSPSHSSHTSVLIWMFFWPFVSHYISQYHSQVHLLMSVCNCFLIGMFTVWINLKPLLS